MKNNTLQTPILKRILPFLTCIVVIIASQACLASAEEVKERREELNKKDTFEQGIVTRFLEISVKKRNDETELKTKWGHEFDRIIKKEQSFLDLAARPNKCLILDNKEVWCLSATNYYPKQIENLPPMKKFSYDHGVKCGISENDEIWCWGKGTPEKIEQKTETPVIPIKYQRILGDIPNEEKGCKLDTNKSVWCWNSGTNGQVSEFTRIGVPQPVIKLEKIQNLRCATYEDNSFWCWDEQMASYKLNQTYRVSNVFHSSEAPVENISHLHNITCSRQKNGIVNCWKPRDLGIIMRDNHTFMRRIKDQNEKVVKFDKIFPSKRKMHTNYFFCGKTTNGHIKCWYQTNGSTKKHITSTMRTPDGICPIQYIDNIYESTYATIKAPAAYYNMLRDPNRGQKIIAAIKSNNIDNIKLFVGSNACLPGTREEIIQAFEIALTTLEKVTINSLIDSVTNRADALEVLNELISLDGIKNNNDNIRSYIKTHIKNLSKSRYNHYTLTYDHYDNIPEILAFFKLNTRLDAYLKNIEQNFIKISYGKTEISNDNLQKIQNEKIQTERAKQKSKYIKYDLDLDGIITKEEIKNYTIQKSRRALSEEEAVMRSAHITKFDTNDDGILDNKETSTLTKDYENHIKNELSQSYNKYLTLDPNGDNILTKEEMIYLAKKAFRTLDFNNDGLLDQDESRPWTPKARQAIQKRKAFQLQTALSIINELTPETINEMSLEKLLLLTSSLENYSTVSNNDASPSQEKIQSVLQSLKYRIDDIREF